VRLRAAFPSAFLLAAAAAAQQPAAAPAAGAAPLQPAMIIYKIELNPMGTMFAMNEPVLQGDSYVFRSLPERNETSLPKSQVKSVARWSGDYSKEVVWQVDLAGSSGTHLVRDEPVKKGKNYVAHIFKNGTLVSVPETDVVKITRLTGPDAFKAEMTALGVVVLAGESTTSGFKGGNAPVNAAPGGGAPASAGQPSGNWTYQGQPGATDAYAPAGGTVSRPGDTPMAPTPH